MKKIVLSFVYVIFTVSFVLAQSPEEIVKKAYEKTEGNSQYAEMTMKIVRPKWQRELKFRYVSLGKDYSLVLITFPPKEQGQTFLLVKNEMWMWNPSISRIVKLGPSMMSQGWMNSDYSNDELLNSGSIVKDYDKKLLGVENINGMSCYKIQLTPKAGKNIVWGKQIMWITKDSYLILKNEFYDEDDFLVKTHIASDIKKMDGREIPTKFEIISEDNPDNKTVVIIDYINFDIKVSESFFTQQNMRKGMAIRFPVKK